MPVPVEKFVKQLEDSGILAGDTIKDFIPPKASPKNAEELARELVRLKKLTKFQAEEVYKGNARSLVLGNYVLLEKIGAGGMGQVFKAEHRRMKRVVAIKVLPASTMKDPATVARFEREVEAAAKLRHPNIVAADDADCANGVHFLVMELVDGDDLSAAVKKTGPFSVDKAISYILQAARGLEAAHEEGIVHRDVKPANLLLDKKGTVKILDMGLARFSEDTNVAAQAELTSTGTIMGTVDYMAPEQALSTKTADARADIYSLGCTFYTLITGRAIYGGESLMAKLLAHRDHPIPSLREICPGVTEQIEAVFRKMVAKSMQDRYQTMTEVIASLESCHSSSPHLENAAQSFNTLAERGLTNFLQGAPSAQTKQGRPGNAKDSIGQGRNRWLLIGSSIFSVLLLLTALVVRVTTKEGILDVTVNESDAEIHVLNDADKVEIRRKADKEPISVSVDPGKHRLKVEKDGFTVFGQDFEIPAGKTPSIMANLEPVEKKPAMVESNPVAHTGPKNPLYFQTAGFDQWAKSVAAMPADEQVKSVVRKLIELNPGFDGKLKERDIPTVHDDAVIFLEFVSDNVTDISPVRALAGIRHLRVSGSPPDKGVLSDLSPLNGLPLESISFQFTQVADLSPLQGMKLIDLLCSGTKVADLSPLKGMPLGHLQIELTEVSDLLPLKGMPLKILQASFTPLVDISPLKGSPLEFLDLAGTKVSNLSPLKEMPLTRLSVLSTQVDDHSPIKGLPLIHLGLTFQPERDTEVLQSIKTLKEINGRTAEDFLKQVQSIDKKKLAFQMPGFDAWCKEVADLPVERRAYAVSQKLVELNPDFDGKVRPEIDDGVVTVFQFCTDNVTDISPVRALHGLRWLTAQGSGKDKGRLSDLSPLQGMQLTVLSLGRTKVTDLSPTKGMPLTELSIDDTTVKDLSLLKGMRLNQLNCNGLPITDLSPLEGMPLTHLECCHTEVSDLSPLKGIQLTTLLCDVTKVSDLSPLKGMPLRNFNCTSTKVTDLSPLDGTPLASFACTDSPVSDLSPLKGMELTFLFFSPEKITQGMQAIRQMKSIEKMGIEWENRLSPSEFWKRYDAGEFGKPIAQ